MPQMKHKRLNRDGWGFQYYPYYQMRIDDELFHGLACLIRLTDGEANYWETPKAGRIQVTGTGMTWLELIPDNTNRVITIKYFPDGTHDVERIHYPTPMNEKYQPSVFYVDITDGIEYDQDGIAVYIDKYLDVIFTPEGDIKIDDRLSNLKGYGEQKYLFDSYHNQEICDEELEKEGVIRVSGWKELETILLEEE